MAAKSSPKPNPAKRPAVRARKTGKTPTPAHNRKPLRATPTARVTAKKPSAPLVVLPTGSKQSQLIALLKANLGASIDQLTEATGWQAHTVRGTISGVLRKRLGLNVVCDGEAGSRVYRIVAA